MSRTTIASGVDLDWVAAKEAAQRIAARCDDACFTAPEAVDVHQAKVQGVCLELDAIVRALKITPPGGATSRPAPEPERDAAFDRAAVAVTGESAAALTARLNDSMKRYPDRGDTADVERVDLDFGPDDDQTRNGGGS